MVSLPRRGAAPQPLAVALAARWPRLTEAFYRLPPTPCPSPPPAGREEQRHPTAGGGESRAASHRPPAAALGLSPSRPAAPSGRCNYRRVSSARSCRRGRGWRVPRCRGRRRGRSRRGSPAALCPGPRAEEPGGDGAGKGWRGARPAAACPDRVDVGKNGCPELATGSAFPRLK